jgi:NAD-dependent DNA ligase
MLKTLEYSGIIDSKKQLKIREGDVGNYYTLNLALCFSENIINIENIGNTELRRCPSLSANSKIIQDYTKKIVDLLSSNCSKCNVKIDNNMKFCPECSNDLRDIESVFEKMVKQPINLLKIELIGHRIMEKLQERFKTIKDLMDANESDILKIYLIGPKRLKNIKIAISDYISG